MQFLKAEREPLCLGDQEDGSDWSTWYPWGAEIICTVPQGTAPLCTVTFKWNLHAANVIHDRHHSLLHFTCRRISLEMLCLLTSWLWNKSCILFCTSKMGDNTACETKSQRKLLWRHPLHPLWYGGVGVGVCAFCSSLCVLMHMDGKGCCSAGCCYTDEKLHRHTVAGYLVHGSMCLPEGNQKAWAVSHPPSTPAYLCYLRQTHFTDKS